MNFAVTGIDHHRAPIGIRERCAFTEAQKIETTSRLLDAGLSGIVILSTCNRSEIYYCAEDLQRAQADVQTFYKDYFRVPTLDAYLFSRTGREALNHLFRVSAGLESIVIGEDQILGQIKDAQRFSAEFGACPKVLYKVFREAITTAKAIKNTTKISEQPLSLSYIAVKYVRQQVGSLQGKKALVVGLGEMGQLAVRHLLEEGIEKIYLCNRNHKSLSLEERTERVQAQAYDKRYERLQEVDIVVCATASTHVVLERSGLPKLERPLYLMDLGMPRDIDENIQGHPQAFLYDVDDLKKIADANLQKRQELAVQAQASIQESVEQLLTWSAKEKTEKVFAQVAQHIEEIEEDTWGYLSRKVYLEPREKKIIEKTLHSALRRVMRDPLLHLKNLPDPKQQALYTAVLEELFEL